MFSNTLNKNTAENHKTYKCEGEVSMEDIKLKPEIKTKDRGEKEMCSIKNQT